MLEKKQERASLRLFKVVFASLAAGVGTVLLGVFFALVVAGNAGIGFIFDNSAVLVLGSALLWFPFVRHRLKRPRPRAQTFMDDLFIQALGDMEIALHDLAGTVPPPQKVPFRDHFVYRYVEQTTQQAIVQKLARTITGLYAARVLLDHGLVQEQIVLHRVLDELQEDILFLSYSLIRKEVTDLHKRYLAAFYEEEYDNPENPVESTQKRPMIPRKKIRAYVAQVGGEGIDPSRTVHVTGSISKSYSGFVHAASPQVMDMYGGDPPHFHVRGMLRTQRMAEHADDLCNYFFRAICSFGIAAAAFGDQSLCDNFVRLRDKFAEAEGKDYGPPDQKET